MGGEGEKEGEREEGSLTATSPGRPEPGRTLILQNGLIWMILLLTPRILRHAAAGRFYLSWKRKIVTCVTFVMTEQTIHNFCIIEKMVPPEEELNPQKNSKNKCLSFKIFLPENEQQNIVQIKYRWARGELQQPIGRGVKDLCPEGKPVQGRRANFSKDWPLTFCNNQ